MHAQNQASSDYLFAIIRRRNRILRIRGSWSRAAVNTKARGACTRVARIYARPRGQLQKFALNHEMDSDWKRQTHSLRV